MLCKTCDWIIKQRDTFKYVHNTSPPLILIWNASALLIILSTETSKHVVLPVRWSFNPHLFSLSHKIFNKKLGDYSLSLSLPSLLGANISFRWKVWWPNFSFFISSNLEVMKIEENQNLILLLRELLMSKKAWNVSMRFNDSSF